MTEQPQEVPPAERPLETLGYDQLAELIASGEAQDLQPLDMLLAKGVEHWTQAAEQTDIFPEMFRHLAGEHAQALHGSPADRMNFCLSQAAERHAIGEELRSLGNEDGAKQQEDYARAWQGMASRLTLF